KHRDLRELLEPVRPRLDEHDLAIFRLHQQHAIDEQDLTLSVSPALPPPLAVSRIETHQHAIVETVDESVVHDEIRELRLHAGAFPDHARMQGTVGSRSNLQQLAADAVSSREQQTIARKDKRLRQGGGL